MPGCEVCGGPLGLIERLVQCFFRKEQRYFGRDIHGRMEWLNVRWLCSRCRERSRKRFQEHQPSQPPGTP